MSDLYFGDNPSEFVVKKEVLVPRNPSYMVNLTMRLFNIKEEANVVKILTYFSISVFTLSAIIFIYGIFIGNNNGETVKNPNNTIIENSSKTNQ